MKSAESSGVRPPPPAMNVPKRVWALLGAVGLGMSACSVGPDYHLPEAPVPAKFAGTTPEEQVVAQSWKPAQPSDAAPRGKWWTIYQDSTLSALEDQVSVSNQNLRAAEANYRAAVAMVREGRSQFYPTLGLGPSATVGSASRNLGPNSGSQNGDRTTTDFSVPLQASYTLDLWGSIRRNVEANEAAAQATFADLENARLTYQAQLAEDYFTLQGYDAEKRLLSQIVADNERDLQLTQNLYRSGVDSSLDVSLAQSQLATSQAQLTEVSLQRSLYEHAIATLVGQPASTFTVADKPLVIRYPRLPFSLPSSLLERRPDIASAERQVAAANARVGVATAGYYPTLSLSGSGGFEAYHLAALFSGPSLAWSVGASLAQPIFNGGLTHAQVAQAKAEYDNTVATYRQTVLTALEQVEDQLVSIHKLEQEVDAQTEAAREAQRSEQILENQYQAGTTSYLNVITVKITANTDQINVINVQIRQMVAQVALIEALGGGWDARNLPDNRQVSVLQPPPSK